MHGKISIITPLFNAEKFIANTIESVQKQTYAFWEMLIIDDASTDDSVKIVEKYIESDSRIILLRNIYKKGVTGARNTGLEKADGRYLAFLDADDIWYPEKLQKQMDFITEKNAALSYSYYDIIDEENNVISTHQPKQLRISYDELIVDCQIGCLSVFIDIEKTGILSIDPRDKLADLSLWLSILKTEPYAYCLPVVLGAYRYTRNSLSTNKLRIIGRYWQVVRHVEEHSFINSVYILMRYIIVGIFIKLPKNLKRWQRCI